MTHRKQGNTQALAGAKAGLSERSGRRIEAGQAGPPKRKERDWRTRKDPFEKVWDSKIVPLLKKEPELSATTLFEDLQEKEPEKYPNGRKRTFQRRVKAWKALHGADKEVMFRQTQEPGRLGLSDFTELKVVEVTVGGKPLVHRLYHFRLAFSGWGYVKAVLGGESYTALAEGLQEALWRLGGAPREHRTDSLSAAYKNLTVDEQNDLTTRYGELCDHYDMTPTRNNRGVSHENGGIESPHGHLKRRIKQALLLRESNDFESLKAFQSWLDELMRRYNRRCAEALELERPALKELPKRRTTDFTEEVVTVTTFSTITVKRVLYSVPPRLVGERLRLHLYDDRIEAYVGSQRTHTLPRVQPLDHNHRARCIDYRHLIGQLVRKPQAFRYSQFRDDLLPNADYRQIWAHLDSHLEPRNACKRIVGILALAAGADCERPLGAYLLSRFDAGRIPTIHDLKQRFDPPDPTRQLPELTPPEVAQHALSSYDVLLPHASTEEQ